MTGPVVSQLRRTRGSHRGLADAAIWRSRLDDGRLFVAGRQIAMPARSVAARPRLPSGRGGGLFVTPRLAPATGHPTGPSTCSKGCDGSVWRIDLRAAATPPASRQVWPFPLGSHSTADARDRHPKAGAIGSSGYVRIGPPSRCSPCFPAIRGGWPQLPMAASGWHCLRRAIADRIRACRGRLSRRHDERGAARAVDRPRLVVGPRASSSRCNAARVRTMGIHKPWSPTRSYGLRRPSRLPICGRSPATTAAPADAARHNQRRSGSDAACSSPPRAATQSFSSHRSADMADHHHRDARRSPRPIMACRQSRTSISPCDGRDPCRAG